MWDAPRGGASDLLLWHEMGHSGLRLPPIPLNLPVRVTVRHDDLQVHEVRLSFPAALLRRALGEYVDPFEMSLSEVQSAFIAPAGAELTTHELTTHELTVPDPSPGSSPTPPAPTTAEPPRRRRRFLALAVALLAVAAGATWWVAQDRSEAPVAAPSATPPSATPTAVLGAAEPSAPTSTAASSSQPPPVTRSRSTAAPHRTPSVTLESDLAFDSGSATLSSAAKAAVARAGRQAREAGLSGTIYVDGYTDDVGSAAYGAWLSQRRADAVATYLQSQLLGAPVSIVSQGHGESDPVASNTTAAGRQQNRRVTITLPHP
jgi:outer membrane protein OmpA-like peptidoglycan-associated protein